MKALLLALSLVSVGIFVEYSEDGVWFRIVNDDDSAWYCTITLGDGKTFEKIIYAGHTSPWYSRRGGWSYSCEG